MSKGLDQDQARSFVGHDLEPNSLQKLSADANSRQKGNSSILLKVTKYSKNAVLCGTVHFVMSFSRMRISLAVGKKLFIGNAILFVSPTI